MAKVLRVCSISGSTTYSVCNHIYQHLIIIDLSWFQALCTGNWNFKSSSNLYSTTGHSNLRFYLVYHPCNHRSSNNHRSRNSNCVLRSKCRPTSSQYQKMHWHVQYTRPSTLYLPWSPRHGAPASVCGEHSQGWVWETVWERVVELQWIFSVEDTKD